MSAHNGKRHDFRPVIGTDCRKGKPTKKPEPSQAATLAETESTPRGIARAPYRTGASAWGY